jgi:hypothetical protein
MRKPVFLAADFVDSPDDLSQQDRTRKEGRFLWAETFSIEFFRTTRELLDNAFYFFRIFVGWVGQT